MKLGIFTDSHYSSAELTCKTRYNSKSFEKIRKALEHFEAEKCDFIICLGDLIDREAEQQKEVANLKRVSELFEKTDIKIIVLMGNHDAFAFESREFYSILGEKCEPQNICCEGKNLIFLDTCYFKNGEHYKPGDTDWTDTYFPETDKLSEYLMNTSGDTYIFLHQNIDLKIRDDHRLFNDSEVRCILEKSSNVKAVFQGHYHPGHKSEHNGVQYVTFPAMCENEDAYYVIEI